MEIMALIIFSISLIVCIGLQIPLIFALVFGFMTFLTYSLLKGFSVGEVLSMSLQGLKKIKIILLVLLLIGVLTASWRASGTIAYVVYYASEFIDPSMFVLAAFLLCCMVSFLMGTSFGTAATMGAIVVTMGSAMGINPVLVGGAMFSGCYFGDRGSPMSSNCLLISNITHTDIFDNVARLAKDAFVPFVITCIAYLTVGFFVPAGVLDSSIREVFAVGFNLHVILLLPAAIVLLLSIFKVDIRVAMSLSIVVSLGIAVNVQGLTITSIPNILLSGYTAQNEELGSMINGGGILSMTTAFSVIGLSACYAGIFEGTHMLSGLKDSLANLGDKITPTGEIIAVAAVTNIITCNQTLAVMLTRELSDTACDNKNMAIALGDTAGVMCALIPWSISVTVPLSSTGAPMSSILAAFYIILLPLWYFTKSEIVTRLRRKHWGFHPKARAALIHYVPTPKSWT